MNSDVISKDRVHHFAEQSEQFANIRCIVLIVGIIFGVIALNQNSRRAYVQPVSDLNMGYESASQAFSGRVAEKGGFVHAWAGQGVGKARAGARPWGV